MGCIQLFFLFLLISAQQTGKLPQCAHIELPQSSYAKIVRFAILPSNKHSVKNHREKEEVSALGEVYLEAKF